jgi:hypothetical protein
VKATFSIILVIPSELVALSNMPIKEMTMVEPEETTIYFEKTPIMSTYVRTILFVFVFCVCVCVFVCLSFFFFFNNVISCYLFNQSKFRNLTYSFILFLHTH